MNKVHFSSQKQDWETPQCLFDEWNARYDFQLDVCANWKNHKCGLYYGQHFPNAPIVDGLNQDWHKGWDVPAIEHCPPKPRCWMNPPYGREIKHWVKKASEEAQRGCLTVALLPARTDTQYFHSYIYQQPQTQIHFLKGRLKFVGAENSAPFPSMIVIFRPLE